MRKIIVFIFISLLLISGCKEINYLEEPSTVVPGTNEPKFHTQENEGRWADMSEDHIPVITYDKDRTKVLVEVPLKPNRNPRHYIQVIALMRGDKEIETRILKFTLEKARAEFSFIEDDSSGFSIMVKCNLHDMWKQPLP